MDEHSFFDIGVLLTFFSRTLDPLVTKNGSNHVNNTNIVFLTARRRRAVLAGGSVFFFFFFSLVGY